MARSHLLRAATDAQGNLLYDATVTVSNADYSVPITQSMYTDGTSFDTLSNPFVITNGIIDFWLDTPQRVSILVQSANSSDILVYQDANPPANQIVYGDQGLQITNQSTAAGQVLLSTGVSGVASWGTAPSGTGLTPIVVASSQSFNSGTDPVGWNFSGANVGARAYDPYNVPPGTNYQYVLEFPEPGSIVQTPVFTFLENGTVSFWAQTQMLAGQALTVSLVDLSSHFTTEITITDTREWGFYSFTVVPGTWSIEFNYSGTGGTPQGVYIAGYVAEYGGNVPAHNHSGFGSDSVALGTSANALATGSTAIGYNANASGVDSSALGYGASATGNTAIAVGNSALANEDYTIAIGASATGSSTNNGWVSIGYGATSTGVESVAVGYLSQATANEAVAIGAGAVASGQSAVAIGQNAAAASTDGFALGVGATVGSGHTNSVAIGAGAATTTANQVMIGNANTIATMAGTLTANGQVALGGTTSRVGFYGTAGVTKPVVNGSDNGNVVVRALIQALATMGLVTNNTVQQPAAFNAPVGNIDYFLRTDLGTGSLGVSDFDFQPYAYAPLAYAGSGPFAATPQWSITSTHFATKQATIGLAPIKNTYNVRTAFSMQMQVVSTGALASGDRFVLTARHTGATDGTASCVYLVFDYTSATVSLGINNGSGNPSSYTVASGNSIALTSFGANPFDGSLHTLTVIPGNSHDVGLQIDSQKPIFFRDATMNTTGTYMGFDTNSNTLGNIAFSALTFVPPYTFDGFKGTLAATTSLANNSSGQAWTMIPATGSSTVAIGSGVLTLTTASGFHIGAYVTGTLNTMGRVIQSSFTTIPGSGTNGVMVHYQDANNYVLLTPTIVIQLNAGTQTTLATLSTAIVANDLITITMAASGVFSVLKNASSVATSVTPTITIPQNPNTGLYASNGGVLPVAFLAVRDQYNQVVYK